MIRVEQSPFINHLIKEYLIPDSIRDSNPIIAGGSILHLYLNYSDEESNQVRYLKSYLAKASRLYNSSKFYHLKFNQPEYAGDIDIWYSSEEEAAEAMSHILADCVPKDSSNWAATFRRSADKRYFYSRVSDVQIIKKIAESPEDLISSFDIANCMIAWQDGKLYVDSRLDEAFEAGEIRYVNNPFDGKLTIASKLFNALRLYKYADKYSLSFSKDIDDIILKLYMEADDIDLNLYDKKIEVAQGLYGKSYASVNTVKSMMQSLANRFHSWYAMNTFREENLAFFVTMSKPEMSPTVDFVKRIMYAEKSLPTLNDALGRPQ